MLEWREAEGDKAAGAVDAQLRPLYLVESVGLRNVFDQLSSLQSPQLGKAGLKPLSSWISGLSSGW